MYKKYCSICTAASESLHLSALLSPLLLLVDFLRCGRVFCHKPGPEEVHPEQVHSTSWSLPHTQRWSSISRNQSERKGEKTTHHLWCSKRILYYPHQLQSGNPEEFEQFCRLITVCDLQMKSYFLYYVRVCFQTRTAGSDFKQSSA